MKDTTDKEDIILVKQAKKGNRKALECLIKNHQDWIYSVALRMVGNPDDAMDVTQEIIIKLITKLSTFRNESSFKTWLYRIATNHIINMKRYTWERMFSSFERHTSFKDRLESQGLPGLNQNLPDEQILIEETKSGCLTGMLLCLDRTQRLVFILGSIFGIDSKSGSKIMEISQENYRQILSRARKQLSNYMNDKCGLINESNPCRCSAKTKALIKAGIVDPDHLRFNKQSAQQIKELVKEKTRLVDDALEIRMQRIFKDQNLQSVPDRVNLITDLLNRKSIRDIINYN